MRHFVTLLWLLCVRGNAEVTVPTTNTKLETTEGGPLLEETTTVLKAVTNYNFTSKTLIINALIGSSHDITSGRIYITGSDTLLITNFYFDGKAPKAYFLVGKGYDIVESGTKVQLPEGSDEPLTEYDGQNIELKLPNNMTVADVDWLAIWCYAINAELGHVYITVSPYPPQTYGFKGDEITSGPIVLVDKKTLFIPDLRYEGGHPNAHFWVGNGSECTSNRRTVPDENGMTNTLHSYQGKNIHINLIDDISTDNVECFGVGPIEDLALGSTFLKGIEGVPEVNSKSTNDKPTIMRLPKCCQIYSVITSEGCDERPSMGLNYKLDFKLFEHNETHFNNASLNFSRFDFQPYVFSPGCNNLGKFLLNETEGDEFAILKNGSLLVKSPMVSGILSQTQFCIDNVEGVEKMNIFVCFPEQPQNVQQAMFVAYVTLTLVSTFCFAGTFFLYCFWLKIEDIHRKCFTAYVLAMAITFLTLTIVQIGHVEGSGCGFLGFLFQFSMIASFTLLAILCVDILVIVRYIDDKEKTKQRKTWYLGTALGVPILFLIVSLARNLTPDVPTSFFKPQYNQNNCAFEAASQRTAIFYVPISIALVVSIICLAATKITIVQYDRGPVNYYWIDRGTTYKFMFRQCLLTLVIMTISWIANMLMNFLDESSGILNAAVIFEALQGVLIVAVFTANHYGSSYVERHRIQDNNNPETLIRLNHVNAQNPCTE